jgi:hypothetical protein
MEEGEMPTIRSRNSLLAHATLLACAVALWLGTGLRLAAQDIPARLADSTFWRMVTEFSEPGGYFRSDNFVSNENSYQWVIPELQKTTPHGVYLGVAPDQNFTYIVAMRPKIAFLFDIRRQMVMQQLLYKALIELSADRADFVSRLFCRPRPAGLDTASTVEALMRAYFPIAPDSSLYRRNWNAIKDHLSRTHGFTLSDTAFSSIEYVYDAFYQAGPEITYNFGTGGRGGGFGMRNMPNYASLVVETDSSGIPRSYLATEENYRILKDYETRNLMVPVVGDFAGPKAIRAVGQYLRDHKATVTAFYTSNVEQYLFQGVDEWRRYYSNVAALPIDSTSLFIRSLSQGGGGGYGFRQQSPYSRSIQLVSSISGLLKAFAEGRIQNYGDVILMSRQ